MNNTSLTIQDLNTEVNHEPRIMDIRLAEFLGFERPRTIRQLIERHKEALEQLGGVCCTVAQTSAKGGRPATVYHLNKKQCVFICTKSETAAATEKTIEVIEVYDAHLKGTLQPVAAHKRIPRVKTEVKYVTASPLEETEFGELIKMCPARLAQAVIHYKKAMVDALDTIDELHKVPGLIDVTRKIAQGVKIDLEKAHRTVFSLLEQWRIDPVQHKYFYQQLETITEALGNPYKLHDRTLIPLEAYNIIMGTKLPRANLTLLEGGKA